MNASPLTEAKWKERAVSELKYVRALYEDMTGHHTSAYVRHDQEKGHVFIELTDLDELESGKPRKVCRFRAKGWDETSRQMESVRGAYQCLFEVRMSRKWKAHV